MIHSIEPANPLNLNSFQTVPLVLRLELNLESPSCYLADGSACRYSTHTLHPGYPSPMSRCSKIYHSSFVEVTYLPTTYFLTYLLTFSQMYRTHTMLYNEHAGVSRCIKLSISGDQSICSSQLCIRSFCNLEVGM